jgi:hypothetical protein
MKSGRSSVELSVGGYEKADFVLKLRSAGAQIVWVPAMRVKHCVDPRRMTLEYLRPYVKDLGRASIRFTGIPPGKHVHGVPRWLLREWLEVTAAHRYNSVRRNRQQALEKKTRQWQLTGKIPRKFL